MKRSLIAWDENELPRATLSRRVALAREAAAAIDGPLDAFVVYADLSRANPARALANFIPYWGASLLAIPTAGGTVLLCGNSPRVYPWLRTVTFVDELRPSKDLGAALVSLADERAWKRVGVVDLSRLPFGIHRGLRGASSPLDLVELPSRRMFAGPDDAELAMRRHAARVTRSRVEACLASLSGPGHDEHALVARLELALRGDGMTDTFIRLSDGAMPPRPPSRRVVDERTSVFVAADYRGHWVVLSRPVGPVPVGDAARGFFLAALSGESSARQHRFDLSGDGPFVALSPDVPLEPGRLVSLHVELADGRLYGDTGLTREGVELL